MESGLKIKLSTTNKESGLVLVKIRNTIELCFTFRFKYKKQYHNFLMIMKYFIHQMMILKPEMFNLLQRCQKKKWKKKKS